MTEIKRCVNCKWFAVENGTFHSFDGTKTAIKLAQTCHHPKSLIPNPIDPKGDRYHTAREFRDEKQIFHHDFGYFNSHKCGEIAQYYKEKTS